MKNDSDDIYDQHPGASAQALIRYNRLLNELRFVGDRINIDFDGMLRNYRSFSSPRMLLPARRYQGLGFIGQVAQGIHKDARIQVGKIRHCLDTETFDREHPNVHLTEKLEALEWLAETHRRLKEIDFGAKGRALKDPMALRKPRDMANVVPRYVEAAKLADGYKVINKKAFHALRTAIQSFSARQPPATLAQAADEMCSAIASLSANIIIDLTDILDGQDTLQVPISIAVEGKQVQLRIPNIYREFRSDSGEPHRTTIARILAASRIASIANQASTLPESVRKFNVDSIGVTQQVIVNADMVREYIQEALHIQRPDLTQAQLDDALNNAGFGFTESQHKAITVLLRRHAPALLKLSNATGADLGGALRELLEMDGVEIPLSSDIRTETDAGIALLEIAKDLGKKSEALRDRTAETGKKIVRTGRVDKPKCQALVAEITEQVRNGSLPLHMRSKTDEKLASLDDYLNAKKDIVLGDDRGAPGTLR